MKTDWVGEDIKELQLVLLGAITVCWLSGIKVLSVKICNKTLVGEMISSLKYLRKKKKKTILCEGERKRDRPGIGNCGSCKLPSDADTPLCPGFISVSFRNIVPLTAPSPFCLINWSPSPETFLQCTRLGSWAPA